MSYLRVTSLDLWVIVFYFFVIIANGIYQSVRKTKGGDDFLLGGKSFGIFSTLCTQGATMKGSSALVGYSAGAYVNGASVLISSQCYSLGAWIAVMSGIARKIKKCSNSIEIRSAGDIFLRRFESKTLKKLVGLGGTWMSLSILSSNMAAIGLLVHLMFGKYGLTYEYSLILGVCIAVAYTAIGGLVSVVYNDVLQWCIMMPLIFFLFPYALVTKCGVTPEALHSTLNASKYFSLQPNLWWFGFLLGGVLAACCDVSHLTRFITAKDEKTAVTGSMFGFTFCVLLAGFVVFFGLSAAMLIEPSVLGDNKDGAIFALISRALSPGFVGLMLAAILAATISTIDSNLQTAVLCTMVDIVEPSLPKNTTEKQKLLYCRLITVVIAVLSIFFVLKVKGIIAIIGLGFNVYSSAIFFPLMGCMFWKKATAKGLVTGILVGAITAIITVSMKLPLPIVWGVSFSAISTILVSKMTAGENTIKPLLPGFNERGQKIDSDIFKACFLGASGSLILSIGIGTWVNWIYIIIGTILMFLCIKMLDSAFKRVAAH